MNFITRAQQKFENRLDNTDGVYTTAIEVGKDVISSQLKSFAQELCDEIEDMKNELNEIKQKHEENLEHYQFLNAQIIGMSKSQSLISRMIEDK